MSTDVDDVPAALTSDDPRERLRSPVEAVDAAHGEQASAVVLGRAPAILEAARA
ncbi:MAG: hypothetical protein QOG20_6427 [Pseudonocardiales bacterium]|jgi:hypothetical protein|nr:hypothetical protein [Pseudonocardiales bacterium]